MNERNRWTSRFLVICDRISRALLSLCLASLSVAGEASAGTSANIYVSNVGIDSNSGLTTEPQGSNGPVQSLQRALDIAKSLRDTRPHGTEIVVNLLPGTYRLNSPVNLDQTISGTAGTPLIIQGDDAASVRVTGTQLLNLAEQGLNPKVASRMPLISKMHVLEFQLGKNRVSSWKPLSRHSYAEAADADASELFVAGIRQRLAGWPVNGYAKITDVTEKEGGAVFKISPNPTRPWDNIRNVWAYGYWYHDWADAFLPIHSRLDDVTFSLSAPLPVYGIRAGQRVRFENIPEELSEPGQWYFDVEHGSAFVWVDTPSQQKMVEISIAPNLLRLSGAKHIRLKNITFDGSRGDLITANAVEDFVVENCVLKNAGKAGLQIKGLTSGIRGSTITDVGGAGVVLQGGDRETLSAANLFATSNVISRFGQTYRTYQPAVRLDGVGNRADHNQISDAPHSAIIFSGNDHLIAYNEIHDVVRETGDAGAVYTGRDWTARGTRLEYNYLHDIYGIGIGSMGIYLDDQASGIQLLGNVFFNVRRAIYIGGGVDNFVEGNLFVRSSPAVYLDNRGMTWLRNQTLDPNWDMQKRLKAVPYDKSPYKERYPTLGAIASDGYGIPKRNVFRGNIVAEGSWAQFNLPPDVLASQNIGQNWIKGDPGFIARADWNSIKAPPASMFKLAPDSQAFKYGFRQIPLDQIGLDPK